MKKIALMVMTICLMTTAVLSAEGQEKGTITALEGEAQKKEGLEADWFEAALQMDVNSSEILRTLPESFAEVSLLRGTVIRLAPKTTVNMLKLYEESKDKIVTQVEVEEGEIWGNVNKAGEDELFAVDSSAVTSSIVGTIFRINTDDSGTLIKVYKGNVEVSGKPSDKSDDDKDNGDPVEVSGPVEVEGPKEVTLEEWTVIVREMMELRVDSQGRIMRMDKIDPMSPEEKNRWVEWNKERDSKSGVKH